jgi:hypothetical protein
VAKRIGKTKGPLLMTIKQRKTMIIKRRSWQKKLRLKKRQKNSKLNNKRRRKLRKFKKRPKKSRMRKPNMT